MRFAAIAILIFLTLACAERRQQAPSPGGADGVSPSESVPPPSIFPHPAGWVAAASHGLWVVQYDSVTCLKCHEASSDKTNPPACSTCHPLYPHATDWARKENHGAKVLAEGTGTCATQCHGPDLQGGLSGLSCALCHTIYPHAAGWNGPDGHGKAAEGNGKLVCKACHGGDLLGGSSGVSCQGCHPLYPHDPNWIEGHRPHVASNGTSGCATQCHGTDMKGGLSGIGCNSCHDLYPHSDTWETNHGAAVTSLGKGACQGCHGADFKTIVGGKNCYSCHDYPHPDPAVWIPFAGGHGEKLKSTYGGATTDCEKCHGADLTTLKAGKNCFTCHPSYLHSKMPGGPWKEYAGHGQYALPPAKKAECPLCHGANYQGGVRGNPTCFNAACHSSYPHLAGWKMPPGQPQEHGNYVNLNTTTSCATARCHGAALIPTPGTTNGPSCSGCHPTYPHPANWSPPLAPPAWSLHGPVAKADIAKCKTCHGGDGLDFAPPGSQTCEVCHPSYRRHGSAATPGMPLWGGFVGHGSFLKGKSWNASECTTCHGDDFSGGVSLVGCNNVACHASYPQMHTLPWRTTGAGHGNYIHSDLSDNLVPCKKCHGNNLAGGHTDKSCFTCHPGYPHAAIPAWSSTAHGPQALTPSGLDGCRDCHGADLMTLKGGKNCVTCHSQFPHPPDWMDPQTEMIPSVCCDDDEFEEECWPCDQPVTRMVLHGQRFVEQKIAGFPDTPDRCSNCHGVDYAAVLGGNSCLTCHAGYPHVASTPWAWVITPPSPPGSPPGGGHTPAFLAGPHDATSGCTACHTNFGKGLDPAGGIGGSASACSSCHVYPHPHLNLSPDSWIYRAAVPPGTRHAWQYNHGWKSLIYSYTESHGGSVSSCKECHGANYQGGGGSANELKRCARCHTTGVVSHTAPNWRPPAGHGKNYIRARLAGYPAGLPDRCLECHSSGPTRCPVVAANPFVGEFPASGADWCNACHKAPPLTCP